MSTLKFKRFTKPHVLKQIGRQLLGRFLDRFNGELAAKNVALPPPELKDDEYFKGLAGVLMAPEGLPDNMSEALFAIDEMANDEGQERLQTAVKQAGLDLGLDGESSHADLALQVWLADPKLLADQHNEQRLIRLATFEYYGRCVPHGPGEGRSTPHPAHGISRIAAPHPACGHLLPNAEKGISPAEMEREKRAGDSFSAPGQAVLDLLVADLDAWFAQHNRGNQTANIEVHQIDGEWWFLIRHGDTFTRTAKVDKQKTEVLHFRPAKDDVVVYSPERDEIRVHAATKGEKELYRTQFGQRLHGDDNYFSERKAYTLEPLREDGVKALSTDGIEGIRGIVLCELEVAWGGDYEEVAIRKANDMFAAASARNREAIPPGGRMVRAVFEFTFKDSKKPRKVQIRPPNVLKFGRHCDARLVNRWLSARGFRRKAEDGRLKAEGQRKVTSDQLSVVS